MLDKVNSEKLLLAVLERVNDLYPKESKTQELAHQIANIATTISVIALQEYEKLNQ